MASWLSRFTRRFRRSSVATDDISDEWVAALDRVGADMAARKQALLPLAGVVTSISQSLYAADPIGLRGLGAAEDEYDSEAETIVMRLGDRREVVDVDHVRTVVHEEFVRWFDATTAGSADRYGDVAADVHRLWQGFLATE